MTLAPSTTAGQDRALEPAPRWRRWRWPAALLLLLLLALLGLGRVAQQWRTPRVALGQISVAKVAYAALVRDVNAQGKVVAAASPTLFAPAAGTLQWQVQAGDAVQQGQLLAAIQSPELEARVRQEQAAAQSARAEWLRAQAEAHSQRGAAQAAVETARLALAAAQLLERRQRTAFEAGASSALEWEAAKDQLARARIELEQAQSALALKADALRFEVQARLGAFERAGALAQELERQLASLQIKAPQSGAIGQRLVADGASVARDAALLTLVDLRQLDVQVQVPESLARELSIGLSGEVEVNGQRVPVTLVAISPEVVNSEVAARLRFVGAQPPELRQNQRLTARIVLERRERVLGVARGPFVDQLGGHQAWVLEGQTAKRRAVRLGTQSIDRVEILAGLREHEQVVISGLESQASEVNTVLINP